MLTSSSTAYCTRCGGVRNLRQSTERQQTRGQDGKMSITETITSHCETCGAFISHEIREIPCGEAWNS